MSIIGLRGLDVRNNPYEYKIETPVIHASLTPILHPFLTFITKARDGLNSLIFQCTRRVYLT